MEATHYVAVCKEGPQPYIAMFRKGDDAMVFRSWSISIEGHTDWTRRIYQEAKEFGQLDDLLASEPHLNEFGPRALLRMLLHYHKEQLEAAA